jgi:hypothetical protein
MSKAIVRYKLLTQQMTSHGGMQWHIGGTNKATKSGNAMCTDQVLHCYAYPELAVLLNPVHANIKEPRLFKIHCSEIVANDGLKQACKEQTLVEELSLPVFSTTQRVAFGIKCALLVYKDQAFISWAEKWLSGEDRTVASAESAAEYAAWSAAEHAAESAARSAEYAARYAEYVAWSAKYAAWSAARSAAEYAAESAKYATWYAEYVAKNKDMFTKQLQEIAEWVLEHME